MYTEKYSRSRYNAELILQLDNALGEYLKAFNGYYAQFFSSAPIRKAALISLINRGNRDYVVDAYHSLVAYGKTGKLPKGTLPIIRAMVRHVYLRKLSGRHSVNSGALRKEVFCDAMYMFNPRNANKTNFKGALRQYDKYKQEAIDVVDKAFNGSGI